MTNPYGEGINLFLPKTFEFLCSSDKTLCMSGLDEDKAQNISSVLRNPNPRPNSANIFNFLQYHKQYKS